MNTPRQQPPKLAVRMFSFFVPFHVRETLLGDLLEKFQEVQSPTWFWREVVTAILLSLTGLFRPRLSAVIFAIAGTVSEQLWFRSQCWKAVWQSSMFQSLYGRVVQWPFPLGVIYGFGLQAAISTINILLLLCLFWSFKRSWRWTNVGNSILLCFPLLTVGLFINALLPASYASFLRVVPTFGALIIAIFISDSAPDRATRNPRLI